MDREFLPEFRVAIESGDFRQMAGMYSAEATFEGFLPGGVREAKGPAAIVALLAGELGPATRLLEWHPIRATTVDVEILGGEHSERKRQIHKVAVDDGLIRHHWAYPVMLDSLFMGDSGARHRRVEAPDGTITFEKQISPSHDWIMRATNDRGREAVLWRDGPLRDLAPSIEYPVVSADPFEDGWLITTRDVSSDLLPDEPTFAQWQQVIDRLVDLHERFRDRSPDGLCLLGDRLAIFSERTALAELAGSDRYPKLLQHGWREAPRFLPADLAAPILALARDPAPLVRALSAGSLTLIHGDANQTNLGLRDGRLIALDWAMAARAPAVLEFTWMLSGAGDLRDDVLEAARGASRSPGDERSWRLAMLFEFLFELPQLAYARATAAPEHVAAAATEFSWWLAPARDGLAALGR